MGAAGLAAMGAGVATIGSQPSAAAQVSGLSASDVSVSSNDGTVSTLTIDPSLTIEWNHFQEKIHAANVMTRAWVDGGTESTVDNHRLSVATPSMSGSVSPSIDTVNLLTTNGGVIDPADLEDTTEGDGPEETTVHVRIFVRLREDDNNVPSPIPSESVTFTVSVTNEAATASISGSLNTGGT